MEWLIAAVIVALLVAAWFSPKARKRRARLAAQSPTGLGKPEYGNIHDHGASASESGGAG